MEKKYTEKDDIQVDMNDYYNDNGNNNKSLSIKKILVPIDSSKLALSTKLANYAIHIAELEKQKEEVKSQEAPIIVIINVIEDIRQGGAIGLQAKYGNLKLIEGFKNTKEDAARQCIIPLEETAKSKGLNIKSVILPSQGKSVSMTISNYAKQNDIDLIILGAGDLFKLKYLLAGGSITGKIIKNCRCPILLVH